ncbi:MAG TPA: hybrid sensor histidine kinase/response regulator [Polyangiaceae bacterium]|jgi:CheY-like chemotaxis protein/nitrogen-specific signal transduction histidine kinase
MSGDSASATENLARELEEVKAALQSALAEADRQRQQKEVLEEAVRSRDAVLSVVAHDLRNPLNIVSLAAKTLSSQLSESSARGLVERIVRSVHRADRMVRDLLDVSAIETGRFSVETHPVEAAELILGALESQHTLAAAASVIVAADVSPRLPPLKADAERLLDVLENLIGNAIKFTSPGGSVTVGASSQGDEILLWVKDNGAGIAPEQVHHIFDRFWQAKKKERRGVGLGLSICKGIVEAHGGRIWAESTAGVGTTMFFTIPAGSPRATGPESHEIANILLVDDRAENLLSLQTILERPDYHLVTARSGEEALALALRENFAVALVDIAMPGMNGLEVAVHLKELERSREIPIIFVTAFGDDPEEIHRAYSAGGADYLVKPLDVEIVRKKVAVFVDLSRRQQRNRHSRPSVRS